MSSLVQVKSSNQKIELLLKPHKNQVTNRYGIAEAVQAAFDFVKQMEDPSQLEMLRFVLEDDTSVYECDDNAFETNHEFDEKEKTNLEFDEKEKTSLFEASKSMEKGDQTPQPLQDLDCRLFSLPLSSEHTTSCVDTDTSSLNDSIRLDLSEKGHSSSIDFDEILAELGCLDDTLDDDEFYFSNSRSFNIPYYSDNAFKHLQAKGPVHCLEDSEISARTGKKIESRNDYGNKQFKACKTPTISLKSHNNNVYAIGPKNSPRNEKVISPRMFNKSKLTVFDELKPITCSGGSLTNPKKKLGRKLIPDSSPRLQDYNSYKRLTFNDSESYNMTLVSI